MLAVISLFFSMTKSSAILRSLILALISTSFLRFPSSSRIGVSVDCTQNSLLNEIVSEKGVLKPSTILNSVREEVIRSLKQGVASTNDLDDIDTEKSEVKDGMDAALCALDMKNMSIEYAGAYNSLYFIKSDDEEREVQEIKADKWPIGIWGRKQLPFSNHEMSVNKGDVIYLFSDGFQDQFGGPHGKKYSTKQFKRLLSEICDKPMDKQNEILDSEFENWSVDLEPIDDVFLIGFRVG